MKKIRIYKGAAIVVDEKAEFGITTNTGGVVDEVPATSKNIKKYIRDKKYPDFKPKKK